jgi:hypothetical protein
VGKKNLTFASEGNPLCFQTVGVPPKAGDIIGEARVRTVYFWPDQPDYCVVVLGRLKP